VGLIVLTFFDVSRFPRSRRTERRSGLGKELEETQGTREIALKLVLNAESPGVERKAFGGRKGNLVTVI